MIRMAWRISRYDHHRSYEKVTVQSADPAFLIPPSPVVLGKIAETPSVLQEDGVSEHTAYGMRLDTISVIEVNISKHPCSHGSMIRSCVSSHIIPWLMTGKEYRSAAYSPMYHHPHHPHYPRKRNKRPRVSQSHSLRLDQHGHHSPDGSCLA